MITTKDLAKCHISSGDGASSATAFVFDSDYSESEAISLEYDALNELYECEGNDFMFQKLLFIGEKCYDAITFKMNDSISTVYFDITKHFGK